MFSSKTISILFFALLSASKLAAIDVIVPVYFEPSEDGNSCTDWEPLISS